MPSRNNVNISVCHRTWQIRENNVIIVYIIIILTIIIIIFIFSKSSVADCWSLKNIDKHNIIIYYVHNTRAYNFSSVFRNENYLLTNVKYLK